jgi:hypothetical protein
VFTAYDVFLSRADGDGRQQFAEASNAGGWRVVRRGSGVWYDAAAAMNVGDGVN